MRAETAARWSAPGQWQSLHIHYSRDPRRLLVESVAPLVADLRSRNLLAGWFYENDWLEGAHVRLRLKPARAAQTTEVLETAEAALDRFLARHPALVKDQPPLPYETLFALAPERRAAYPNGRMPTQIPNTIHYRAYEPEYGTLGGPEGVALAEWHFEYSSDQVLDLLAGTTEPRVAAAHLAMTTMSAVLRSGPAMRTFAARQQRFWLQALPDAPRPADDVAELAEHLAVARENETTSRWASHCADLRTRLAEAAAAGTLLVPLTALVTSYIHRTNNRLGLSPVDEAYQSQVVYTALRVAGDPRALPKVGAEPS